MPLRERLGSIIFGIDTPAGRAFDVVLLWAILLSVLTVLLESVASIRASYGPLLLAVEWTFTALFTLEYVLRIGTARRPARYVSSFYGIVDLLAVLPAYLAFVLGAGPYVMVLRALRLLRAFRILKLTRYLGEADVLGAALLASRPKITVFLSFVLTVVLVMGSLMYVIEGPERGFTSIPLSMYWAIVTLTTVGFGDIYPQTPLGRFLASALMILGYGVIAVPTGIVTTELVRVGDSRRAALRRVTEGRRCESCELVGHEADARFCRGCGARLAAAEAAPATP
jgi:voltage-gated potassium channel